MCPDRLARNSLQGIVVAGWQGADIVDPSGKQARLGTTVGHFAYAGSWSSRSVHVSVVQYIEEDRIQSHHEHDCDILWAARCNVRMAPTHDIKYESCSIYGT